MRVLILDDHPLFRCGIREVILASFPSAVVRESSTGGEALRIVQSERVGLAILDIVLPDQDGITILRQIKKLWPQTRCLMVTIRDDPWSVRLAMRHGASGYLVKGASVEEIQRAMQIVMKGGWYVSETLLSVLDNEQRQTSSSSARPALSAREHEVLALLSQGRTVSQVAKLLQLSVKTVSTYRSRLLEKLSLETTADLIRYAVDHQMVR